jgi:hypothetical protein
MEELSDQLQMGIQNVSSNMDLCRFSGLSFQARMESIEAEPGWVPERPDARTHEVHSGDGLSTTKFRGP